MKLRSRDIRNQLLSEGELPSHHHGLAISFAEAMNREAGASVSLDHEAVGEMLSGRRIVIEGDIVYRYGGGIWEALSQRQIRGYISALDGCPSGGRKPFVELNAKDKSGVLSCFFDIEELQTKDFFSEARSGVPLVEHFISIERSGGTWGSFSETHSHRNRAPFLFDAAKDSREPTEFLDFMRMSFDGDADLSEKIQVILEFIGLTLAGMAHKVSDARALFLQGRAASGKSTIIEVIQSLFPAQYVASQAPDEWEQKGNSNAADFKMYSLKTCRLNAVGELPDLKRWTSAENFKKIVTGDAISLRGSGKNGETVRLALGNIYASNHDLTDGPDQTEGFDRRCKRIDFNNTIGGTDSAVDKTELMDSLRTRALRGRIIDCAIKAAVGLLNNRERYTVIPSSQGSLKSVSSPVESPLTLFLQGCDSFGPILEPVEGGRIRIKDLHPTFEVFANEAINAELVDPPQDARGREVSMGQLWLRKQLEAYVSPEFDIRVPNTAERNADPSLKQNNKYLWGWQPRLNTESVRALFKSEQEMEARKEMFLVRRA